MISSGDWPQCSDIGPSIAPSGVRESGFRCRSYLEACFGEAFISFMYAAKQRHATFLRCDDANNIDINFLFVNGHISVQVLLTQKIKNAHAQNSDPGIRDWLSPRSRIWNILCCCKCCCPSTSLPSTRSFVFQNIIHCIMRLQYVGQPPVTKVLASTVILEQST